MSNRTKPKKTRKTSPVQVIALPARSRGHVCFARGELNSKTGVRALPDNVRILDDDWEFFIDADGVTMFRTRVEGRVVHFATDSQHAEPKWSDVELVLKKQTSMCRIMGRVRWPAIPICTGINAIIDACQKLRTIVPKRTRELAAVRALAADELAVKAGLKPARKPESELRVPTPGTTGEMPDRWTLEIRQTAKLRKYKVYIDPTGKQFQSFKKVQQRIQELADDANEQTIDECASKSERKTSTKRRRVIRKRKQEA